LRGAVILIYPDVPGFINSERRKNVLKNGDNKNRPSTIKLIHLKITCFLELRSSKSSIRQRPINALADNEHIVDRTNNNLNHLLYARSHLSSKAKEATEKSPSRDGSEKKAFDLHKYRLLLK